METTKAIEVTGVLSGGGPCKKNENIVNPKTIDSSALSSDKAQGNDSTQTKRHPGYGETPEGMSRKQFKRMKKAEMKEKSHKEWRAKNREKEREKRKLKKQAIREGLIAPRVFEKVVQEPSALRVALDMSFDSLMIDKELASVGRQVQRCYSDNKRAKHPIRLHVTSHTGKIKEWFDTKAKESVNWQGIDFHEKPYEELFAKEDLVYLTADSDNVISTLDESKVYVIGGIVDKNRHKLLTLNKAKEQGIATAQLPIGDFIKLVTRKVLAVNHVYEILIKFLEYKDWEKAFRVVIPQRKFNQDATPDSDDSKNTNAVEDK